MTLPIRKKLCIALAVLIVGGILFVYLALGPIVKALIERYGSRALGAKVSIESLSFRMFAGEMEMAGLEMANPDNTMENMFQADVIQAQMSFWPLLRGRLVVDKLYVKNPRTGVERTEDGRVEIPKKVRSAEEREKRREGLRKRKEFLDKLKKKAKERDWVTAIWERLRKHEAERQAKKEEEAQKPKEPAKVGKGRFGKRIRFPDREKYPRVLVREVTVEGMEISFGDKEKGAGSGRAQSGMPGLTNVKITMRDLAIRPGLWPKPLKLTFGADVEGAAQRLDAENGDKQIHIEGTIDLRGDEAVQTLEIRLRDFDLKRFSPLYAASWPVRFEGGTVELETTTPITLTGLDLASNWKVAVKGLELGAKDEKLFGKIPSGDVCDAFKDLGDFELAFYVRGRLTRPETDLFENLGEFLRKNGIALGERILKNLAEKKRKELEKKLKKEKDKAIEKGKDKLRKRLRKFVGDKAGREISDKLGKGLGDAIGGLADKLPGKKKESKAEEDKKKDKKEKDKKKKSGAVDRLIDAIPGL